MIYPTIEAIIEIHKNIIENSGGLFGVKELGQLDSILEHMKISDYYPNFEDKITHLTYSIAKFHIFNDANKRTAIASGALFLNLNNKREYIDLFIRGMEVLVMEAVTNNISKEEFNHIVKTMLGQPI